MSKDLFQTMF